MKQLKKLIKSCLVTTGLALTMVSSLFAQSKDPLNQNIQNKLKTQFIRGTMIEVPYYVPMAHELIEVCKDTICFKQFSKQIQRYYYPLLSKSVLSIVDKSNLLALNMIYITVNNSKQVSPAKNNLLKILAPFKKVDFAIDQNLFKKMLDTSNPLYNQEMDNSVYDAVEMNLFFVSMNLFKSLYKERSIPIYGYFPSGILADDEEDVNFRTKFKEAILNKMIESKDSEFEPSIKYLKQMKLEVRTD